MAVALTKTLAINATTGWTVYAYITRLADGNIFDASIGFFELFPQVVTPNLALTEQPGVAGLYTVSDARSVWQNGFYTVTYYRQLTGTANIASDTPISTNNIQVVSDAIQSGSNSYTPKISVGGVTGLAGLNIKTIDANPATGAMSAGDIFRVDNKIKIWLGTGATGGFWTPTLTPTT